MGTNSPVRWATRMSPGPKTTASAPSAIMLGASVPKATVPEDFLKLVRETEPVLNLRRFQNSHPRALRRSRKRNLDHRFEIFNCLSDETQDVFRFLPGDGAPLEREAAFAGNDVLGAAAFDDADVQRRVGRIETGALIALSSSAIFSMRSIKRAARKIADAPSCG